MTIMNFHYNQAPGNESVVMPAGEYFLCDPCYCFEADWEGVLEACKMLDEQKSSNIHYGMFKGKPMVALQTAFGDGEFADNHGFLYPVDAGMIGLVPVDIAERDPMDWAGQPLGQRVTFLEPFDVTRTPKGILRFGPIRIDTSYEDDE